MKATYLKCNVCEESPEVKIPDTTYDGDMLLCPSCDKRMAYCESEAWNKPNLIWRPIDTDFNKEWGGIPVTIINKEGY